MFQMYKPYTNRGRQALLAVSLTLSPPALGADLRCYGVSGEAQEVMCTSGYCSKEARDQLFAGRESDGVVLITHQSEELQADTAEWLKDNPSLASFPRLWVVAEDFPMRSIELAAQVSRLYHSKYGRVQKINLKTPTIHLVGGFCARCLKATLRDALAANFRNGIGEVTVKVYADLVYPLARDLKPFRDLISAIASTDNVAANQKFTEDSMIGLLNVDFEHIDYVLDTSKTRFVFRGNDVAHFEFRTSAGQRVKVDLIVS